MCPALLGGGWSVQESARVAGGAGSGGMKGQRGRSGGRNERGLKNSV